jgi:hypothetical protein
MQATKCDAIKQDFSVKRREFVIGLAAALSSLSPIAAHADVWGLVTEEEFNRDAEFQKSERRLSAPPPPSPTGAPVITVREPDQSKPVRSPVTIRIAFRSQEGSRIDVRSFRATYGAIRIDITQRLLDNARLSETGLSAENAQLPSGHHMVTLAIADSMHRVGTLTIRFTVVRRKAIRSSASS